MVAVFVPTVCGSTTVPAVSGPWNESTLMWNFHRSCFDLSKKNNIGHMYESFVSRSLLDCAETAVI